MTICISGGGACTPVGLHAAATCAALRAGIANLTELATMFVSGEVMHREPLVGGRAPTEWLDGEPEEEEWPGHERFGFRAPPPLTAIVEPGVERILELLRVALGDVSADADLSAVPTDRYRVYLGLNESEPVDVVRDELRGTLGGSAERFIVECSGRAAGLSLLKRALDDMNANVCDGALVGGVDSLIREPVAKRLNGERRIKSNREPQGLIPGEGAAFIYLESEARARQRGQTPMARVLSAALGDEPSAMRELANRGTGLSTALRRARAEAPLSRMPLVICDLNGERPRHLEWMLAGARAFGDLEGDLEIWHPADCIGDCGAAAGPLSLLWGAVALSRGYAPAAPAAVWGASDGGLRAAAILDRSPPAADQT